MNKKFRTFVEARKYVHSQGLKSNKEWRIFHKSDRKPADIPTAPNKIYAKEWTSWGDWLGTGFTAFHKRNYLLFTKAVQFVNGLDIKNKDQWELYCKSGKKPANIPSNPHIPYKKEWKGWGYWLGTRNIRPQDRKFRSFEDARIFVRSLGLNSQREWTAYYKSGKKPQDIPSAPQRTYKKGWKGMGDWLGTGVVAPQEKEFLPFEKARQFIKDQHLASVTHWRKFLKSEKNPGNIPANPEVIYKNKGWINYGDWLGTGTVATFNRKYLSFNDAKIVYKNLAKKHGIRNRTDWIRYINSHKIPAELPKYPWEQYAKEKVIRKMKRK